MDDVSKEGRTILFVSHNLLAVENLCNRAIFLNKGKMLDEGSPSQVISSYIQPFFSTTRERIWSKVSNAPGNEDVRLHKVSVRPLGSKLSDIITISTPFILEFEYWNFDTSTHLSVCLCLYNEQDILVFDICSPNDRDGTQYPLPTGLLRSTCCIPGNFLNNGLYRVSVKITHNHSVIIDQPEALTFSIADSDEQRDGWYGKWPGVLRPILDWEINIPIKANPDFESGSFSKGNDVV
jgi:lipopolysaccharide transport system ATP-binding protein